MVREGLAEKVTFDKILEGKAGARHWKCGGNVLQGTTRAKALGRDNETDLERHIFRDRAQTRGDIELNRHREGKEGHRDHMDGEPGRKLEPQAGRSGS